MANMGPNTKVTFGKYKTYGVTLGDLPDGYLGFLKDNAKDADWRVAASGILADRAQQGVEISDEDFEAARSGGGGATASQQSAPTGERMQKQPAKTVLDAHIVGFLYTLTALQNAGLPLTPAVIVSAEKISITATMDLIRDGVDVRRELGTKLAESFDLSHVAQSAGMQDDLPF